MEASASLQSWDYPRIDPLPPGHPAHHWRSGFHWPHWPYPPATNPVAKAVDHSRLPTAPPLALYEKGQSIQAKSVCPDRAFPPEQSSLGPDPKWGDAVHRCVWKRCRELRLTKLWEMDSFSGHAVSPNDINQGQLGDCWLLSSIACLAEFPEAVRKLFVAKQENDMGVYTLLLYDTGLQDWVPVTVDDYLPCFEASDGATPAFAHAGPGSKEMWPCLLEKAFAKVCGGYQHISGGWNWFAFQMLTGSDTSYYMWSKEKGKWLEDFTSYWKHPYSCAGQDTRQSGAVYVSQEEDHAQTNDDMWAMLLSADENRYIMAATTAGVDTLTEGKGPQANTGMVDGHAYSVLVVKKIDGHRLLCLRNPWGTFEFGGDWSDRSDLWQRNPHVKTALVEQGFEQYLQFKPDDGVFWMDFKDASAMFNGVIICRRGVPIDIDKRTSHAEKCTHCSGPLIAVEGKFEGRFYKRKSGVQVHVECWDAYCQAVAPKCLQCDGPIMELKGRYSGRFYRVDQDDVNGKVHTECWNGIGVWKTQESSQAELPTIKHIPGV